MDVISSKFIEIKEQAKVTNNELKKKVKKVLNYKKSLISMEEWLDNSKQTLRDLEETYKPLNEKLTFYEVKTANKQC